MRALADTVGALRDAMPPMLVDIAEAAERSGVSVSTLRRRIRAGEIPVRRLGRRVRVDLARLAPLSESAAAQLAADTRYAASHARSVKG